jgi:hypothetical protein
MKNLPPLRRHGAALLGATALACLLAPAQAQVLPAPYAKVQGALATFEELVLPDPAGSQVEGLVNSGGIWFGERFDGQELAVRLAPRPGSVAQDWFDDLSFGAPVAGLQLLPGAPGANLGGYDYADTHGQALAGIGPQHPDGSDPFGFGAISARFAAPVSALGLQVREADGGAGWLRLYREDGVLIDTVHFPALSNGFFAFARPGAVADIAGFSLYHADTYYGIAIDNVRAGALVPIPEPATTALWVAGLVGLAACCRRRLPRPAGT